MTWFADAPLGGGPADGFLRVHVTVLRASGSDAGVPTGDDAGDVLADGGVAEDAAATTGDDAGGLGDGASAAGSTDAGGLGTPVIVGANGDAGLPRASAPSSISRVTGRAAEAATWAATPAKARPRRSPSWGSCSCSSRAPAGGSAIRRDRTGHRPRNARGRRLCGILRARWPCHGRRRERSLAWRWPTPPARGPRGAESELATARQLFTEGVALEDARDWAAALDRFRRVAASSRPPRSVTTSGFPRGDGSSRRGHRRAFARRRQDG